MKKANKFQNMGMCAYFFYAVDEPGIDFFRYDVWISLESGPLQALSGACSFASLEWRCLDLASGMAAIASGTAAMMQLTVLCRGGLKKARRDQTDP